MPRPARGAGQVLFCTPLGGGWKEHAWFSVLFRALNRTFFALESGMKQHCIGASTTCVAVTLAFSVLFGCGGRSPQLTVRFRSSAVGIGKVLILTNASNKTIHGIRIVAKSNRGDQVTRDIPDRIEPNGVLEVGWLELDGWKPEPGETFFVTAEGFPKPLQVEIPD